MIRLSKLIESISTRRLLLAVSTLVFSLAFCANANASVDDATFLSRVQSDTKWLNDFGTRQIGTEAHARLQDELLAKLKAVPGVKVWTDEFPVVVPSYEKTTLTVSGGAVNGAHDIYPLWPDVARLNTTPLEGIEGRLIYVGHASFDQLPAHGLQGQIAVMEMSAYEDYRRVFDHGAAALILLGSDKAGKPLPTTQSLFKPRYFVPAGPLADALREGKAPAGMIVCKGRWKTVTARNIYVAVKPSDDWYEQLKQQLREDNPEADEEALEEKYQAAIYPYSIVAPYDSMSRVYGVAPGADAALDCAIVMNLLRDVTADAPRPLLFGFVDSYHINQIGMRRMAAMLMVTPDGRTRKDYRSIEGAELRDYEAALKELDQFEGFDDGIKKLHDRSSCELLRRMFKDAVGRDLLRLRELQGDMRLAAMRTKDENTKSVRQQTLVAFDAAITWLLDNHRDELESEQLAQIDEAAKFLEKELETDLGVELGEEGWTGLAESKTHAEALKEIFNFPVRSRNRMLNAAFSSDLDVEEKDLPIARENWDRMAERVRGQVAEQKARLAYFEPLDELRGQIGEFFSLPAREGGEGICPFVLGLDLSDCGFIVGPGSHCEYNRIEPIDRDFVRALKRATKQGDVWGEDSPMRRVVNINAIEGRIASNSALGNRALITSAASSFLLNGVTWITDDAPRKRIDSPVDRYDQLDWERIAPQLPPTRRFVEWLLTTDEYQPRVESVEDATAKWRHGMGRIVDVSAGETVPRVPRRDFLATFVGTGLDRDGIRRHEFAWTGHDGSFRVPIMCADVYRYQHNLNLEAFRLDGAGAFIESLSTTESQVSARLATSFSLGAAPGERLPRAVTFECTELNGPSFYDARFLEPLTEGKLLDAVRGGAPKQSHFNIDQTGQMWGVVEPGIRWQLVVRAGAAGVRMALLNAVKDARKRGLSLREAFQGGYPIHETLPSIPANIAAHDIFSLNQWRLTDFRAAGIQSDKIDEIRDETKASFELVEAAIAANDGAALRRAATRAMASEIRAYRAISDTGQDVARGAIFLMLMLVPFAVAMERLLFACSRIGPQIASAMAIFAVMTLVLWSFHPAFRISAQPLVIVMAFVILAMSVAVISIVLARFRASMREFQSSLAEGSGAQMGRGGLLGSAVFLGIANMRKRKVRTALTGMTLVLVTFALLCFSSASSYVDKKDFRLEGVQTDEAAVMVRRPTFGPITWLAPDAIQNLLRTNGVTVESRAWLVPGLAETNWRIWIRDPETGEQAPIRGALGLPPNEDRLSGIDQLLPNWSDFAEEGGCYLSEELATQLGVKVGDRIDVRGYDLILRGVFQPIAMEDQVRLLDGQRILPYDYSRQEKDWVNRDSQDAIEQENESAAGMQPTGDDDELFMAAREVIILPTDLVRELGGDLRSIAIPCESTEQAAEVARELSETIVYPAYYANGKGGVNVVVATPLIAVPPRSLAVPLVIAALIIFTTMLNSVSERKKEIYVYSSLGLAPCTSGRCLSPRR
jgi:hypothetical protein